MLDTIKKLFAPRTVTCPACSAWEALYNAARGEVASKEETVLILKDEVQYLRAERAQFQDLFNRAIRLNSPTTATAPSSGNHPTGNMHSWARAKAVLESQNRKHVTPEDEKAAYWRNKSEQLAQEAGITDASQIG